MTLNVFRLIDSWLTQCWGARGLSYLSVCHSIASPFNQILGYKEKIDRSQYSPLTPFRNWDEFLNLVGIKVRKSSAKSSFKTLTVLISSQCCTAFSTIRVTPSQPFPYQAILSVAPSNPVWTKSDHAYPNSYPL